MKLNGFVLFQIMVFDFDKVLSSFDVIVSLPAFKASNFQGVNKQIALDQ